jgi:hypothetical protein
MMGEVKASIKIFMMKSPVHPVKIEIINDYQKWDCEYEPNNLINSKILI